MYVLEAAWPLARAPAYGGDGGAGGANSCPAGGGAGSSFGAAGGGGKFNTSLSPLLAAAPGGGAGVACGAVATLMRGNALARTCVRGKPDAHDGDTPPPSPAQASASSTTSRMAPCKDRAVSQAAFAALRAFKMLTTVSMARFWADKQRKCHEVRWHPRGDMWPSWRCA